MKDREDRHLTADELARLIGVTVKTLQSDGQAHRLDQKAEKRKRIVAKRERDLSARKPTCEPKWDMTGNDEERRFTIGELARLVGVTVRTLQYYDQADLLNSAYTEGGKRIYTRDDVLKLQQILFLKSLGFSLEEINDKILEQGNFADFEKVFAQQREILLGQIANLNKSVDTLDLLIAEIEDGKKISMEKLMTILKLMKEGNPYSFIVHYFNDEQFEKLADRFDSLETYEQFMGNATEVFARLDTLYRQGADPAGPDGQELAKQWWTMVSEFTAGNPGMLQTLVSSGKDIDNWPEDAKSIQEPIKNFLSRALGIYLHRNGITITSEEAKKHD